MTTVTRPADVTDFHEQDWLIILEALMYWADETGNQVGTTKGGQPEYRDPRRTMAYELAGCISDHLNMPPGKLQQQVDQGWDGSNR